MSNPVALSIDLNLPDKLQDRTYRQKFFLAEASARIAAQLIALRKRRGLSQKQVAEITGTKQPAISRCEQADYQNWSFNTLRSIADALDARISVAIEPSEDILVDYNDTAAADVTESVLPLPLNQLSASMPVYGSVFGASLTNWRGMDCSHYFPSAAYLNALGHRVFSATEPVQAAGETIASLRKELAEKERELSETKAQLCDVGQRPINLPDSMLPEPVNGVRPMLLGVQSLSGIPQ